MQQKTKKRILIGICIYVGVVIAWGLIFQEDIFHIWSEKRSNKNLPAAERAAAEKKAKNTQKDTEKTTEEKVDLLESISWSAVKNFAATLGIERSKVKVDVSASKQVAPNCFIIWVSVKKLPITGVYDYLYVPEKNKLFLVSRQIVDRYTGVFSCSEEDKARYKIWWKQVEKALYK